jgi:carbamoyltransferase
MNQLNLSTPDKIARAVLLAQIEHCLRMGEIPAPPRGRVTEEITDGIHMSNIDGSMRQLIVGWSNTFHDPAIAFIEGERVFAEAIERHAQCKRALDVYRFWYSRRPLETGLRSAGIWPVDNAEVSVVTTWDLETLRASGRTHVGTARRTGGHEATLARLQKADRWDETMLLHERYEELGGLLPVQLAAMRSSSLSVTQLHWILARRSAQLYPVPWTQARGISTRQSAIPHHLAHAANAVYTSPFEECMVLVLDGVGDEGGTSIYHFANDEFTKVHACPTSLGNLYSVVTTLCGFDAWEGEEWKVMGLAAYGRRDEKIYEFFRSRLSVRGLDIHTEIENDDWMELFAICGGFREYGDAQPLRAADLAHTFQLVWEEAVIELCQNILKLGRSKNLCFAGGCALNSSANGKLTVRSGFERLHVPSAPADDGNALGAALYEKHCVRKERRVVETMSPYLGNDVDLPKLERILSFGGLKHEKAESGAALCDRVSDLLVDGKIIAWMQGRAEFGPRALGNRSILADPRRPDMQDLVNARVKFREEYRPLAPSILHEYGPDYFKDYQESPYMDRALRFHESVVRRVPAVVHKDGTGRLQTVKKEWNPLYHGLIKSFFDKTGIPILVNTSLNVMGKPIVHSVEDAITVFFTSGLDHLVIGPYVISKGA